MILDANGNPEQTRDGKRLGYTDLGYWVEVWHENEDGQRTGAFICQRSGRDMKNRICRMEDHMGLGVARYLTALLAGCNREEIRVIHWPGGRLEPVPGTDPIEGMKWDEITSRWVEKAP